jgi:hypothetical protein
LKLTTHARAGPESLRYGWVHIYDQVPIIHYLLIPFVNLLPHPLGE